MITAKYTIPTTIFDIESFVNINVFLTSTIPLEIKVMKKLVSIINNGLNDASQVAIIPVKPILFAEAVLIVWLIEPARTKPTRPAIAPDKIIVLIMTLSTLIPTYFAVLILSPTTEIS